MKKETSLSEKINDFNVDSKEAGTLLTSHDIKEAVKLLKEELHPNERKENIIKKINKIFGDKLVDYPDPPDMYVEPDEPDESPEEQEK